MTPIKKLWGLGQLPIVDALHFGTGESYSVGLPGRGSGKLAINDEIDLHAFLSIQPDCTTNIDITSECRLDAGQGYLICGEGSYGSEGFFGHLMEDKELDWIVYVENANPFSEISLKDGNAIFRSTSGVIIDIGITNPMK